MYDPILRLAVAIVLSCASGAPASAGGPKRLNNLVSELLDVSAPDLLPNTEYAFERNREGWVFVSLTTGARTGGTVWVSADSASREKAWIVSVPGSPGTMEAMRLVGKGTHRLTIKTEGQVALDRLVVRSVPELIFCKYGYDPFIRPCGPYDWAFLRKHVLPHVNCIVGTGGDIQRPFAEEWKRQGGKWLEELYARPYAEEMDGNKAFDYWIKAPGLKDPLLGGVIVDEFGQYDDHDYGPTIKSMRRISKDARYRGKVFYPYLCRTIDRDFLRAIIKCGYRFSWERYLQEPADGENPEEVISRKLHEQMDRIRKAEPDVLGRMIVCLGYFSAPGSFLNVNPSVDYKVWMDMQFRLLAMDSDFAGLYGLEEWTCGYADDETVRWAARLYRHYGIEGRTDLLSGQYGFKYRLEYVRNPDFGRGLDGWMAEPAEPENRSIRLGLLKGYSWLQGRYPETDMGDSHLVMKRSARKPNVIAQDIVGLEPGRSYSLKMISADARELSKGKSAERMHAIRINLKGARVIPDRSFQYAIANNYGHKWGSFDEKNKAWFNYHYMVFRPDSPTVRLSISDWTGETSPGGPVGEEMMLNFIEVQPYFED